MDFIEIEELVSPGESLTEAELLEEIGSPTVWVRGYTRRVGGKLHRVQAHRRGRRLAKGRAKLARQAATLDTDLLVDAFESRLSRGDPRATVLYEELNRRISAGDPQGDIKTARDEVVRWHGPLPPEDYGDMPEERSEWNTRRFRQNFLNMLPELPDEDLFTYVERALARDEKDLAQKAADEIRERAKAMPNDRRQRDLYLIRGEARAQKYGVDLGLARGELAQEYAAFRGALEYVIANRKARFNTQGLEVFGSLRWREALSRVRRAGGRQRDAYARGEINAADIFAKLMQDELFYGPER